MEQAANRGNAYTCISPVINYTYTLCGEIKTEYPLARCNEDSSPIKFNSFTVHLKSVCFCNKVSLINPVQHLKQWNDTMNSRFCGLNVAGHALCVLLNVMSNKTKTPQPRLLFLTLEYFPIFSPRYHWGWFSIHWALNENVWPDHRQLVLGRLCTPCRWLWKMPRRTMFVSAKNNVSLVLSVKTNLLQSHQSNGLPFRLSFQPYTCISPDPSHPQHWWSTAS